MEEAEEIHGETPNQLVFNATHFITIDHPLRVLSNHFDVALHYLNKHVHIRDSQELIAIDRICRLYSHYRGQDDCYGST